MATPMPSLDDTLRRLLDQQDQLLRRVAGLEKPQKDLWDKLGALSGLLIALVGGMFSYLYSSHQSKLDSINQSHQEKLQEVQTVGTFMPYLVGSDDAAKSVALSEVESILSAKAAIQIVEELNSARKSSGNPTPDPVAVRFLQRVADHGKTDDDKNLARQVLAKVKGDPSP